MLLLVVLVLTAIATTVAQLLPLGKAFRAAALLLDLVPVGSVIVATVITSIRLRRERLPLIRLVGGVYGYFAGALVGALGVAHLVAVALAAVDGGQRPFVYTFRVYSLVLLGVLLVTAGLIAATQATRLALDQRGAWRASLRVWVVLLAINLPLVPLQGFAILFSILAALGLFLVGGMWRRFDVKTAEREELVRLQKEN
jgi:hypothetical protein